MILFLLSIPIPFQSDTPTNNAHTRGLAEGAVQDQEDDTIKVDQTSPEGRGPGAGGP